MLKNHFSKLTEVVAKRQSILACHRFLPSTFRPSTFGLLLTFNFALLTVQCGLDVEDPTPPSSPQWVPKSLPEEWPERGIDAFEGGGIYLEWEDSQVGESITGYKIFRAEYNEITDSLSAYEFLTKKELGADLHHIDEETQPGITYYYKIKAEDPSGNLSAFSNSIFYTLLPQLPSGNIAPNGLTIHLKETRQLNWKCYYLNEMEDYCITLLTTENDLVIREVLVPGNYTSDGESWQIPFNIDLVPNQTYKWRIDTGAKYIDGYETSGAESIWATFLYIEL